MSDPMEDLPPGAYEADGSMMALMDQQRSKMRDKLRTCVAVSMTTLDAEGESIHWAVTNPAANLEEMSASIEFLLYVAARGLMDIATLVEAPLDEVARIAYLKASSLMEEDE